MYFRKRINLFFVVVGDGGVVLVCFKNEMLQVVHNTHTPLMGVNDPTAGVQEPDNQQPCQ